MTTEISTMCVATDSNRRRIVVFQKRLERQLSKTEVFKHCGSFLTKEKHKGRGPEYILSITFDEQMIPKQSMWMFLWGFCCGYHRHKVGMVKRCTF